MKTWSKAGETVVPLITGSAPRDVEYRPFPNIEGRNRRQQEWEIPAMIRALGLPTGARVLEVGCGRGCALGAFGRRLTPVRLVGLDIEATFLEEAGRAVAAAGVAAELVVGDVRRLPFPDASFDVVIDFGTCFHIARPARALAEIARVLVPGGVFAHETKLSQGLSHPVRSFGRRMPVRAVPELVAHRWWGLWATRMKRPVEA